MLSVESFKKMYQRRIEKEDEKTELISPEQIELIRVEEEKENYHNKVVLHPKKEYGAK